MGAVELAYDEVPNIFDTGGAKGLHGDSVEKIPKIVIKKGNNLDDSGERVSCSVCLQVNYIYTFCLLFLLILRYLLFLNPFLYFYDYRTFNLEKLLDVCHNVITCSTYHALTHGC